MIEKSIPFLPVAVNEVKAEDSVWDLDLSHLSQSEKVQVQEMLREESALFSKSDNDIGISQL